MGTSQLTRILAANDKKKTFTLLISGSEFRPSGGGQPGDRGELRADDLLFHLRRAATGGFDQMKRTLLASEALAAREDAASHTAARKLARELASQHDTSAWAEAMLERLSKP